LYLWAFPKFQVNMNKPTQIQGEILLLKFKL